MSIIRKLGDDSKLSTYGRKSKAEKVAMLVSVIMFGSTIITTLMMHKSGFSLELPARSALVKQLMDQKTFDKNIRERGLKIVGFNILNAKFCANCGAKTGRKV